MSNYFSSEDRMYVPLSIDMVEINKSNYFLSNKKMIIGLIAFLPLLIIVYPLIDGGIQLIPLLIVVCLYMVGYFYFARFVLFEEKRLRKMVKELDKNRVSEIDHFWYIDKIGGGKNDDGMIYYAYDMKAGGTTKGLIIKFDRGSTVGVPAGHYESYRETKQRFMRKLHESNFDFKWYEMQKKPELQESLIDYADKLTKMDNEYHQKLLKLQLNINVEYSMSVDQRYIDYILVKRTNFNRNFKNVLESIIDETLGQNGYIVNPKILGKREVEEFFSEYLNIDIINSDNIRKSVDTKPFEKFAYVHRLVDAQGKEVPIQFLNDLDLDGGNWNPVDVNLNKQNREKEEIEQRRVREHKLAIENLNKARNSDKITHKEYQEQREKIEHDYSKEHYNPNAKRDRIEKERRERQEERERKREEQRLKRNPPKDFSVKEVDLNPNQRRTYTTGEESLEDLLRNKMKLFKEQEETQVEEIKETKQVESEADDDIDLDALIERNLNKGTKEEKEDKNSMEQDEDIDLDELLKQELDK